MDWKHWPLRKETTGRPWYSFGKQKQFHYQKTGRKVAANILKLCANGSQNFKLYSNGSTGEKRKLRKHTTSPPNKQECKPTKTSCPSMELKPVLLADDKPTLYFTVLQHHTGI
jgi:hypothetical protein